MMKFMVGELRADLRTHPTLDLVPDEMTAAIDRPATRKTLVALNPNYDRWDLLLESVMDYLDGQ